MPQGMTGVTADSPDRFVLDVGRIYVNIDITALEAATPTTTNFADAVATATRLGATRGGAVFNVNRTLREIPVDGQPGPTKGFKRRSRVAPTLQVNIMEHTVANYTRVIAGAAVQSAVGSVATPRTRFNGGAITDAAYIDNIAIAATHSSGSEPVIIVLFNVLADEAPTFTFADEDEMVLPVTFSAHIDPATPNVEPWSIYHP